MSVTLSDEEYEELTELAEVGKLVEIRGESNSLENIWLAGQPVGRIIESNRKKADSAQKEARATGSSDHNPKGSEGENHHTEDDSTPLEQLSNVPAHTAEETLSENQQKAVFVARDVLDYADKTPKGYVVDSGTVSKVLAVRDGETPHTQTVSRTMKFLSRFGKDEVYLKMHKGRRIAVFEETAAKRYGTRSIDPSQCGVISQRGFV